MSRKYVREPKAMTLTDFIKNKLEKQDPSMKQSKMSTIKKEHSIGLSTLLHFHHNDSLSSIRSHDSQRYQVNASQDSRFGVLMEDARKQINDLRSKRLELQEEWNIKNTIFKGIKSKQMHVENEQEGSISQILDESEVDVYNSHMDRPVYPKRNQQISSSVDKFVLQLRRDIQIRKGEQFVQHLKKYATIRILIGLKSWHQLCLFRQNIQKEHTRQVLLSWRDVTDRTIERQNLREMILVRLKKRKQLAQMNTNVEMYLSDL